MPQFKVLSREDIKKIIIHTLAPFGVRRIALFGSFARRDTSVVGDIDILVTLPELKNRKLIGMRWFVLPQELELVLGIPVDLVTEGSLSPRLREIIQRDLEIIYDKAG